MNTATVYRFFWSPEGRPLCDVTANSITAAKAVFRKYFKEYARYMGEVYTEENPVTRRDVPQYTA